MAAKKPRPKDVRDTIPALSAPSTQLVECSSTSNGDEAACPTERLPTSPPSLINHQISLVMTPRFAEDVGGEAELARATGTLLATMLRGDGIEEILVAQMLALHNATMDDLAHARATRDLETAFACRNSANRSSRTVAVLAETLLKIRGKSTQQKVTVEHVHVHAGGQAIVGSVRGRGRPNVKTQEQSHASQQ